MFVFLLSELLEVNYRVLYALGL